MPDWITHLSYVGIVAVLVLTGAGLPLPEEVPVIAAGVASHSGQMNFYLAWACCLVGVMIGDCMLYGIGYHFGRRLLNEYHWFSRSLTPEREKRIERYIARHGWKVFLVARFLVFIRSPVYVTAGILHMPFRRFLLIDAFCATIVVSTFFSLSYVFAANIDTIWHWIRNSQYAITLVVMLAILGVGAWFFLRRRVTQEIEGSEGENPGNGVDTQNAGNDASGKNGEPHPDSEGSSEAKQREDRVA